jgi:hypothetical protein
MNLQNLIISHIFAPYKKYSENVTPPLLATNQHMSHPHGIHIFQWHRCEQQQQQQQLVH